MLSFLFFACSSPRLIQLIYEDKSILLPLESFVGTLSLPNNFVISSADDLVRSDAFHFSIALDGSTSQSYTLEGGGYEITILGSDILGAQYGLAHALEIQGFRFYHPYDTLIPEEIQPFFDSEDFDVVHAPEMERR